MAQPKAQTSNWQVGWASPADEAELLALFRSAFGHAMDPALWRWKYAGLASPGAWVRGGDGQMAAFYGGIPRPVQLFGRPATAVQIGDVMVHPGKRGILTRKGPFFLAASTYLQRHVGLGKTYPVAFGFPSRRAYGLGERLGLYAKVGEICQVDWPTLPARPSIRLRVRPLAASAAPAADRLWLEMAAGLSGGIVGVRDWAYLKRRYLEHPTIAYRLFFVASRLTHAPFGIIVLRQHDEAVELMDMVAPPERAPVLVQIARRLAWDQHKPLLYAWISRQHAALLAGATGTAKSLDITLPTLGWPCGISPGAINERWWLTGGDTDFR